jgi:transposase-like protein
LDWEASGLSVSAFCRTYDISQPSFYYWRRELVIRDGLVAHRSDSPVQVIKPAFVPVRVVGQAPIEVVVRSGQVVRVAAGFDATHLRAVVEALEAKPC